jgi:hypothetical protein
MREWIGLRIPCGSDDYGTRLGIRPGLCIGNLKWTWKLDLYSIFIRVSSYAMSIISSGYVRGILFSKAVDRSFYS